MPIALLRISMLKTPTALEERITSILSNCIGEYLSMEMRIPLSYQDLALYMKEPNSGTLPMRWRSRRGFDCLVKGSANRFLGRIQVRRMRARGFAEKVLTSGFLVAWCS